MTGTYGDMLATVHAFHDKRDLKGQKSEDLAFRRAWMTEELGEALAWRTRDRSQAELAEEWTHLFILPMGNAVATDFDLCDAVWATMDEMMTRSDRQVGDHMRNSRFES